MAYTLTFNLALGPAQTGLTLAAQLVDTAGADVGSEVTTGFVELGNGLYTWTYAAFPDGHRGAVKFYEDGVPGTLLVSAAINPETGEYLDAKVSSVNISGVAAVVWQYDERTLTQSGLTVASQVAGPDITLTRGDSLSAALTGLGALTGWTKIYCTVRADRDDGDDDSLLQIVLSNPSDPGDGLLYLNGADATAGNGSITMDDAVTGAITIALVASDSAQLEPGEYSYDIQVHTATSVNTRSYAAFEVTRDVTRATT